MLTVGGGAFGSDGEHSQIVFKLPWFSMECTEQVCRNLRAIGKLIAQTMSSLNPSCPAPKTRHKAGKSSTTHC
jgi:hypothetical protein